MAPRSAERLAARPQWAVPSISAWLRGLPLPARSAAIGASSLGIVGAIVGLVLGLLAYPPTAPFAVAELGVPATFVGGFVGLVAGVLLRAVFRIKQRLP